MPKNRKQQAYFFLGVWGIKFPTINEGLVRLLARRLTNNCMAESLHIMAISTNREREATLYLWILSCKVWIL